MKSLLRTLVLAFVLLLAQAFIMDLLGEVPAPDLVLLFALAMGLRASATSGLLFAFGLGFAVDVLSGSPLGLYAMLRGTGCAATRVFDRALYLRAPVPWAIYTAGYTVVDGLLLGLAQNLLVPGAEVAWTPMLYKLPIVALLTTLLAVPLRSWLQRLDVEAPGEGAWTTLTSRARS